MGIDASASGESRPATTRRGATGERKSTARRRDVSPRDPAWHWLWVAAGLASVGMWMQDCAAPWLMTELTPDVRLLVALQAAVGVGLSFVVIAVGVLSDTVDRRRLLVGTQLAACLTAVALGVLTLLGLMRPWSLVGLATVVGAGHGALTAGIPGAIPVGVVHTHGGASWAMNAAQLSSKHSYGAVIGGLVVATAGAAAAFFINAAAFLAVALSLRRVPAARRGAKLSLAGARRSLREGAETAARTPTVAHALIRSAVYAFATAAIWALLVVYSRVDLELGALGFGLMITASGVGGLAGVAVLARFGRCVPVGTLTSVLGAVMAAATTALVVVPSLPLAVCCLLAVGAAWFCSVFAFGLVVQDAVPGELRGRAFGLYLVVLYLGAAVGSVVWGHVADLLGLKVTWLIAAGVLVAAVLCTSTLRMGRLPRRR